MLKVSGTWGQKMPEDFFKEACAAKFKGNDSDALRDYIYILEHYPKSKFCSPSYFNIGLIYQRKEQDRLAINAFRKVAFFVDEGKSTSSRLSQYGDKPEAAYHLSVLYEKTRNYDSALYFLYLHDTVYDGGWNGWYSKQEFMVRYADIHLKANRIKDAEKALLSMHVFGWNKQYDGGAYAKLKELFKKYENADTLKSKLEMAINTYSFDTVLRQNDGRKDTLVYVSLNFLDAKVRVPYRSLPFEEPSFNSAPQVAGLSERSQIIANLKKSELYRLIQEL